MHISSQLKHTNRHIVRLSSPGSEREGTRGGGKKKKERERRGDEVRERKKVNWRKKKGEVKK